MNTILYEWGLNNGWESGSNFIPKGLFLGQTAYDIYLDMHHSVANRYIHGLGMPFVVIAVFMAMCLFCTNAHQLVNLNLFLMAIYFVHYLTFDYVGAVLTLMFYFPIVFILHKLFIPRLTGIQFGNEPFSSKQKKRMVTVAILMFSISLFVFQEGIGHTFFEQQNSNVWVFPTSVVISPLFGFRSLFFLV